MVINLSIPEYQLGKTLDINKVNQRIDATLVKYFNGKKVVLRALGSKKHPLSKYKLVNLIEQTGTDRYNPMQKGDRYDNDEGKQIDLFGRNCTVKKGFKLSLPILEGFHVWAPLALERPQTKVDVWLVYDRSQLKSVDHYYPQYNVRKRDGYLFKFPDKKNEALLGIISIS